MVGGELGRRDAAAAAVRSNLVVVPSPLADDVASLQYRGQVHLSTGVVKVGRRQLFSGLTCLFDRWGSLEFSESSCLSDVRR
jgi:hypothetical protein